jgi:asparagine synthase (glutamine-hydrolysing)
MCGIVGQFGQAVLDHPDVSLEQVKRAVESMRHRGPDDHFASHVADVGTWGMCRLAIRDFSDAGRQPFWHGETGVIYNGEIYNTDFLRGKLIALGHSFHTSCDTEILLKAYVQFGIAAFAMLDGIFAVAVVDPSKRQLVLARDEFGVKPLFVSESSGCLSFGSEPKALENLELLNHVDVEQLAQYLRYQYVPEPNSAWVGTRKVHRGTVEVFSLDNLSRIRVEHFKQPGLKSSYGKMSPSQWVDQTADAVAVSVERQMVSDRPLGVFLSGGVDSTLISLFASRIHGGLQAFGISVPGWDRDERPFMEQACAHLDVDLTITEFSEDDFDRLTSRLVATYDEPFADFSALPTMKVSEVAGQDLRVVLSGDGGDELFGGYARYDFAPAAERLGMLPKSTYRFAELVMRATHRGSHGRLQLISEEALGGGHGYSALLALRSSAEARSLLDLPAYDAVPLSRREGWPLTRIAAWDAAMNIDIDQYLPADIHTKVDRASMSVSLEARVPLLGGPVARLASVMPADVKIHDGVRKWPLKEILRREGFSQSFIHRPKTGFSFPISEWLRRATRCHPEYISLLSDPSPPLNPLRTRAELKSLMNGSDNGHAVWSILMLSAWLIRFPI